jgi:hypothetical protein
MLKIESPRFDEDLDLGSDEDHLYNKGNAMGGRKHSSKLNFVISNETKIPVMTKKLKL